VKLHYGLDLKAGAIAAMLAVVALAAAPRPALAAALDQIAVEADPQGSVLTLSLSTPVAPHVFRLHNPDRLVIDLPDTQRRGKLPQPPEGSVVTGLRSGVPDGHTLRLVADLRAPVRPQVSRVAGAAGFQLRIALSSGQRAPSPASSPATRPPPGS
jgi:N-acetylmuramoyl-L-alanine amidase